MNFKIKNLFKAGEVMKIAITDFDGTLKDFNGGIPKSNVEAIHKWRKVGNKFGIATGRNLKMLDFDLKNYDITLDFVICVNGAVIINKDKNILHSEKIPPSVMKNFVELPLIKDSNKPMIVFCEKEIFAIRPYPEMPNELIPKISLDEVVKRDDVVQFGIEFDNIDEPVEAIEILKKNIPTLGGNQNRNYLDININGINKKFGVAKLIELMKWQDCPLFVIGDDKNDLPMINQFNGYTVKNAAEFMYKAAKKVYNSVGDMLIDNL